MTGGPGFFGGMEGNWGTPGDLPGEFEGEPPEGDFQIPEQPGGMSTQSFRTGTFPVQEGDGEAWSFESMPTGPFGPGGLAGQNPPEGLPGQIEQQPPEGDYEIPPQPGQTLMPQGGAEGFPSGQTGEASTAFVILAGGNQFSRVRAADE